jgi:hypothetical protein
VSRQRTQAEGHIDHGTVGRINVEATDQSVTLRLWQHSLKPDATLSFEEARRLVERINAAMAPKRSGTSKAVAAEDFSDIA